jgi:quercetin dioxygenase-like cupin family protein
MIWAGALPPDGRDLALLYHGPMRYPRFHTPRNLALTIAVGAGLFGQGSPSPLENDQVRVIYATDQPHTKTTLHEHKLNRVMIYLTPGRQEITPQGGTKAVLKLKAGEVRWSPASGMHVSEVTSGEALKIVEVEIKKEGDPGKSATTGLDPLKVDPKDYKLEFENSQVRVVRVKFPPHHAVPLHEHMLNRVVVYLTDQNGKMTTPDGKVDTAQHKAGEASWGAPTKHQEENLNDKPFEAIVVELKS